MKRGSCLGNAVRIVLVGYPIGAAVLVLVWWLMELMKRILSGGNP